MTRFLDDSIDAAATDGRASIAPRVVVAALCAGLIWANFGLMRAAVWAGICAAAEIWEWAATRPLTTGRAGTAQTRLSYLGSVALMTGNWTLLAVWYWMSGQTALQIAAIVVMGGQLVHAQAFAFRSRPVLALTAGIPAAGLVVLPLLFGGYGGVELATVGLGLMLLIGYVFASASANIAVARRLRATQGELEKLVYLDALTLLGNRRQFAANLRKLIDLSSRSEGTFALLLIDLDRFKAVNDSLGHDAGDALLVEVGARLAAAVGPGGEVARTGGDEFAILLSQAGDAREIEALCRRLVASFAEAFEINGVRVQTTLSVGVALFPAHGRAEEHLLKSADLALYEAKANGRNTWRYGVALAA